MTDLTNIRSDRVTMVRSLAGRSARSKVSRFLVEGPQGVREAVRFAPGSVRDIYITPDAESRYAAIVTDAARVHIYVHIATPEVLEAMSQDAQGILAVVDMPGGAALPAEQLDAVLTAGPTLVAVLSQVRDPGNAGTVIRAADAAGADLVVLTESSVDIYNPKVVRSTAGSLFHIPVITGLSLADITAALAAHGMQSLAADGAGELDLDDLLDSAGRMPADEARAVDAPQTVDLAAPTAWIFGNEAWGLADEDRALADAVVRVPIRGHAESLNLATAASVCLYASSRAQR
jgi:TrmH family RNA methyltransferase